MQPSLLLRTPTDVPGRLVCSLPGCRGAYCVAFDTNVWLSHLDVVREWWGVLCRAAPRLPDGRPAFVLLNPLAVVRELDGLKLHPVHFVAARAATRLLLGEMQGSDFFRGQRCAPERGEGEGDTLYLHRCDTLYLHPRAALTAALSPARCGRGLWLRRLDASHCLLSPAPTPPACRESEVWRGLSRRGDDGILDCLLRFQAAGAAGVNLCTSDKNLRIRVATEQVGRRQRRTAHNLECTRVPKHTQGLRPSALSTRALCLCS